MNLYEELSQQTDLNDIQIVIEWPTKDLSTLATRIIWNINKSFNDQLEKYKSKIISDIILPRLHYNQESINRSTQNGKIKVYQYYATEFYWEDDHKLIARVIGKLS